MDNFSFIRRVCGGIMILAMCVMTAHIVFADNEQGQVVALLNTARSENGLVPLEHNAILDAIAADKLSDMRTTHYFAHTSPLGVTPWAWFRRHDYAYRAAGENLATGFTTIQAQHDAWMNSPTHRANILSDQFTQVGVAVAREGQTLIAVEVFAVPLVASRGESAATRSSVDGAPAMAAVVTTDTVRPLAAVAPQEGHSSASPPPLIARTTMLAIVAAIVALASAWSALILLRLHVSFARIALISIGITVLTTHAMLLV